MKKLILLLKDFKYFLLLNLLFFTILICIIPILILTIFYKDKPARFFVNLFKNAD